MWVRALLSVVFLVGLFLLCLGCEDDQPVAPHTGSINIDAEPDSIYPPWQLDGPFKASGWGDTTLVGVPTGIYKLTWRDVDGYSPPDFQEQTLTAGAVVKFLGNYSEIFSSGTIWINPVPQIIDAPWQLEGPSDSYDREGVGGRILENMNIGFYALTWLPAPGWITPRGSTKTLEADSTVVFSEAYIEEGFVLIPPAPYSMPMTFTMGSTVGTDETPHEVILTERYLIFETEVTNGQYLEALQWAFDHGYVSVTSDTVFDAVNGSDDALFLIGDPEHRDRIGFDQGWFTTSEPDRPVVLQLWTGAAAYCDWLNLRMGWPLSYHHDAWTCNWGQPYTAIGYRLPTEAEWEMACRANTTSNFSSGDCLGVFNANYLGNFPFSGCTRYDESLNLGDSADVGSFFPNGWGLFDMHGNVWEWCNDWYDSYSGDNSDPVGPPNGIRRVFRGGCWVSGESDCRSANRLDENPYSSGYAHGVRPVRSAGSAISRTQ